MSGARGQANHSLYLARILLAAWQRETEAGELPARLLCQAYLPAARGHLLDAYGWFLLELSGAAELPQHPPRGCAELPAPPPGKAMAGEILEFQQLEKEGWLADLLQPATPLSPGPARTPGNLASAAAESPGPGEVQSWADQLSRLFDRMSDSLDEY
jgi:hypothetical protein